MSMRTQVRPVATSIGEAASVGAISARILADGENSWKGWLAELVDDFRRQPEMTLIATPPPAALPARIRCLLAATVEALCAERGCPNWSRFSRSRLSPASQCAIPRAFPKRRPVGALQTAFVFRPGVDVES